VFYAFCRDSRAIRRLRPSSGPEKMKGSQRNRRNQKNAFAPVLLFLIARAPGHCRDVCQLHAIRLFRSDALIKRSIHVFFTLKPTPSRRAMDKIQKQKLKTHGVIALSAFAALASFYGMAIEGIKGHDVNKEIRQTWPGLADTPAVRADQWTASPSSSYLNAPDWKGVEDSARWAEIVSDGAGPGEIDESTHWSRVRTGRVGEPVELNVQGMVGRLPAFALDIGSDRTVTDSKGNTSTQHDYHYVMKRAMFLHDAPSSAVVLGTKIAPKDSADDGWGSSRPDLITEDHPAGHLGDQADGSNIRGMTTPTRITAPGIVGQPQVAWAYVKNTTHNAQGDRVVTLGSGYAPLSVVQAARAETGKADTAWALATALLIAGLVSGGLAGYMAWSARTDSNFNKRLTARRGIFCPSNAGGTAVTTKKTYHNV